MAQNTNQADLFGGIALGVAALAALLIANSPLGPQYGALIQTTAEIRIGSIGLSKSLEHWINDGLMPIFFIFVDIVIKSEVIKGAPGRSRNRRFRSANNDLCRVELGRHAGTARLGGSSGHRYCVCYRNLRVAWSRRALITEDVPPGARHHRRSDGDHRHRHILYR